MAFVIAEPCIGTKTPRALLPAP